MIHIPSVRDAAEQKQKHRKNDPSKRTTFFHDYSSLNPLDGTVHSFSGTVRPSPAKSG
jgi:hypothetical protein